MSYARISNICSPDTELTNPLTYCATSDLDNSFLHTAGQRKGPYSEACQNYMSDYCSANWDGVCEYVSQNTNSSFPTAININGSIGMELSPGIGSGLTMGELLIRNTAIKKYISKMSGCVFNYEPFDPLNPSSPMIRVLSSDQCSDSGNCISTFEVSADGLNEDPVMNKILMKPSVAIDILINIYNTMNRKGTLSSLQGTRLWNFFQTQQFKKLVNQGAKQFSSKF